MRVALVYPPACDPTAPYLAVPMLTGFLRGRGVDVLPIDANLEAFDALLEPGPLASVRDRVQARIAQLERRSALHHVEQLDYARLFRANGDAHAAPAAIRQAKDVLRDEARFFDPASYGQAVATIEAALRAVSAAYAPLHLDFTAYRTPFGLTTPDEVVRDADPDHDPFDAYVTHDLVPRLRAADVRVAGLSVCFPGQLQPAYAFAAKIKRALPDVHVTCGGPGVTQMLLRLHGQRLARALGPFDSAVLFEGEHTLLRLLEALDRGLPLRRLTNVVVRDPLMGARHVPDHGMEDLKALPAPDFDGLPLDRYLSPRLTLPYDPTRGCYWGKCTFCHYGLAEVGTASYRERAVDTVVAHLASLSAKHGTRHFYFSQDSVAPKTIVKLAGAMIAGGLDLTWGTDLKPEKYLTAERAQILRRAGAVACALGVESAAPRVLSLIDKGAPIETVSDVVGHLAKAGIAAEAMCFTDFPTETADEALQTLRWLHRHRDELGVFIVGEFGLTHGALVAQDPAKFGLKELWQVEGDELGLGLFFDEVVPSKDGRDRERIDRRLREVGGAWQLRSYPWAGAVSTAHTLLYYAHHGANVFRTLARAAGADEVPGAIPQLVAARFDVDRAAGAEGRDAEIWWTLVHDERRVTREAYARHARAMPRLSPEPRFYRVQAGREPVPARPPGVRRSAAPNRWIRARSS